jgi:NADH dehydrogenase
MRDQVRLLRTDKVVSGSEPTLADIGVEANALETIVPGYLTIYRRQD